MHRGGTSALAGQLAALGVAFGADTSEQAVPAGRSGFNARGYWENNAATRVNDALLLIARGAWYTLDPFFPDAFDRPPAAALRDEAAAAFARDFAGLPLWGFKDPRTTRAVPFWRAVLSALGAQPHFVVAVRHPASVAASLQRRDGIEPELGGWLWYDYMQHALRDTEGLPRTFIDYDAMVEQPAAATERLRALLGSAPAAAGGWLDPALRHERAGAAGEGDGEAGVPPQAKRLYALLRALAGDAAAQSETAGLRRRVEADWQALRHPLRSLNERLHQLDGKTVSHAPTYPESAALARSLKAAQEKPVAVLLHLYYADLLEEFSRALRGWTIPFDLYVTVPRDGGDYIAAAVKRAFPAAEVMAVENRGRDILPFLQAFRAARARGHELFCKLHTKKSLHMEAGDEWRADLIEQMAAGGERVERIRDLFELYPRLGLLGPGGHLLDAGTYLGGNRAPLEDLARAFGLEQDPERMRFFAGSMFWFRDAALRTLHAPVEAEARFEAETGQTDGTLAHGFERIFGALAEREGYWVRALPELLGGEAPRKPRADGYRIDDGYAYGDPELLPANLLRELREARLALAHAERLAYDRQEEAGRLGAGLARAEQLAFERAGELAAIRSSWLWKIAGRFLTNKTS